MNYFEHHIGDYAEATGHLSFVEDAAYSRCIRKYYSTEKPLPAEIKSVQRLIGARSKEERDAVQTVLAEFFDLQDDGWHNARCDEEIARYRAGEPEREAKKANEETRLRRHREERAALFQVLVAAGQHAAWNIGIKELRAMVKALQETAAPQQPATAPATPATATQTPLTNTHISKPSTSELRPDQVGEDDLGGRKLPPERRKASADDETCARYCFDLVRRLTPTAKEPNFDTWANDVRLMVERDSRTHRQICELFQWANSDAFWQSNILSPAKLREKWDQLTLRRTPLAKGAKHGDFGSQDYRAGVGKDGSF